MFTKKEEIVSCEECGCLVKLENAQKVEVEEVGTMSRIRSCPSKYFCKTHRKPYARVRIDAFSGKKHYALIEVDAEGVPAGHKKCDTHEEVGLTDPNDPPISGTFAYRKVTKIQSPLKGKKAKKRAVRCSICGKKYRRLGYIPRHMRAYHGA